MKPKKPRKAPKVPKYNMDKNYMKENNKADVKSKPQKGNPQYPLSKKKFV
jgi:hypothetical protein